MNADEEHIRAVLAFIRPHKNVIDYELLPYHRFGLGKYESLGVVYELDDYKTPSDEVVQRLQAIIDEAFGRSGPKAGENEKKFGCEFADYEMKIMIMKLVEEGNNDDSRMQWRDQ